MNQPIRIGSVGLGCIAQAVHLPGIARSSDLKLAAICDLDPEKLRLIGDRYGVDEAHRFTDYRDLLRCPDVDAVDIATPNDVHFQIAMDTVSAGKPYALEKPITMTAEQADQLAAHTKEMGVKNMVCFSYRFKTAARYARELVQRGMLGELYHVDMQYFQAWGLPDAHMPLVWRFVKERTGSGALGDLGCHALDLCRFVTGREYQKIVSHADTYVKERPLEDGSGMGRADVDDFCNYLCRMEGGVSASFQITRFAFGRGNYQRMEIYGSKGALVYTLDVEPDADQLEICLGEPAGETHDFTRVTLPNRCRADQMQCFADLLLGRGDGLAATIEDGRVNQHTVDAVIRSFEEERWISV